MFALIWLSEHTGIGFARNNTGPSAQHLDGGGSEGRSSPFDPFVYDLCSSISDNRTISSQLNGCDFFPNEFRREKRGTPIRPMCVYVCRHRDPSATVWGKLKRSFGGVVRSSPYFLRVAVRFHEIYRKVYHISRDTVTCSGRPRFGA